MIDINQCDINSKPHGYWEVYHDNGKLWYSGNYVNGEEYGYWVEYHDNGKLQLKEYLI